MEKQNELAVSINGLLSKDNVKQRFSEIMGEKANAFISSVLNVVKNNGELSKADPKTILNASVVAATLDLPIDPNLGFAAIIPYKNQGVPVAQFQIMYKGLIQLAQRSGQYRTINVCEIYEGELISENRVTGEYEFDFTKKKSNVIIGYTAYFKLINGFEKTVYWSIEKIETHAKRFSKIYKFGKGLWADKDNGGFEAMAAKTVLKYTLSKFGPMTIDFQTAKAVKYDQAVIQDDDNIIYVDGSETDESDTTPNIPNEPAKARRITKDSDSSNSDPDPDGVIAFEKGQK
jgi:recombination protein RecT